MTIFQPEDRLTEAYKALDALLDKYNVDICANTSTQFWFEEREKQPPKLKIVKPEK